MKRSFLSLLSAVALGLLFCAGASADIINVPDDYTTIQAGIDAALDGDTVLVAAGTYMGEGNRDINFCGKAITVRSEHGAESCIIDCEGSEEGWHRGFYFHSGEDPKSILDGFTIKNGYCRKGGGIYCDESSPTIKNNTISDNSAGWLGGGIFCEYSSSIIENNTISNNSAEGGGGIFCRSSSPTIENNTISDNSSVASGGGICCYNSSSSTIGNNTISNNTAGRQGGGIYCYYRVSFVVIDSIVWGNTALISGAQIYLIADSSIDITYSDIQGGWEGEGNIDEDPCFEMGPLGDYYLSFDSPCIDTGSCSVAEAGLDDRTTRVDGIPDEGTVDMGYHYPVAHDGAEISLSPGWNMISLPLWRSSRSWEDILVDDEGEPVFVPPVYSYDPAGHCYNEEEDIDPGKGYWVLAPEAATVLVTLEGEEAWLTHLTWTTADLPDGWNMIGAPFTISSEGAELLTLGEWLLSPAYGYDAAEGRYTEAATGDSGGPLLRTGAGYWVLVDLDEGAELICGDWSGKKGRPEKAPSAPSAASRKDKYYKYSPPPPPGDSPAPVKPKSLRVKPIK